MDFAPLWFPVVVGLAFLAIAALVRSKPSDFLGSLFQGFRSAPLRCLWSLPEKIFLLWLVGVGAINFALALWIIHVRLKFDLWGWILS